MPRPSKRLRVGKATYLNRFVKRGACHQGDRQFSETSAGKQCSCNALVAIAFLNMYDVITSSHINKILQEGDKLYRIIRERLLQLGKLHISERLTTKDLPSQLFMGKVLHKFTHLNSIYGKLGVDTSTDSSKLEPLDVIVHRAFQISNTNIMVIGNDMVTLFNYGKDRCGIFDSHSRNNKGMPTNDGCAVLLYFPSLPNLVDHVYKLVESLSLEDSTVLEVKPITISSTLQTNSGVSSFAFELFFQHPKPQKKSPCTNTSPLVQSVADKPKKTGCQHLHKNKPGGITKCKVCKVRKQGKGRPPKRGRGRRSKRRMRLESAFTCTCNPFVSETSGQTSVSQKETLNHCKTKEESEILLLTREIQKLENYLSFNLEKTNDRLLKDPNWNRYILLSNLTAAKIILFNKPRAREVMQITVASFMEQSTKLDPSDETVQCLSSVEKKLCERLDVVKVPDKDGTLVPILLTPRTKKTAETLVDTRSQFEMDPSIPYLFAKYGNVMNSLEASEDVLNTVAEKAGLLRNIRLRKHVLHTAAKSTGLLQDVQLQKQVAAISQIMAMQNDELDWLKSHISDVVAVDRDFSNLQASTLEMAKVVQLLHAIESGQAHHCTQKSWSQLQLSDITSSVEIMQDNSEDVRSNANHEPSNGENLETLQEGETSAVWSVVDIPSMAEYTEEPIEEKYSDVLKRANVSSTADNMEVSQVEDTGSSDVRSIVTLRKDRDKHQQEDSADVSDDEPSNGENLETLQEGESSAVWSIKDIPSMAEYTEEPIEEKYSVLKRANVSSTADNMEVSQVEDTGSSDVRSIVTLRKNGDEHQEVGNTDASDIPSMAGYTEEPMEEKYSDVLKRANLTSTADYAKEMAGKNNVIKRESLPNKAEDGGQDEEDDKSVIRISVDLSNVYEDIYDSDELPEEKYSDVMNM